MYCAGTSLVNGVICYSVLLKAKPSLTKISNRNICGIDWSAIKQ